MQNHPRDERWLHRELARLARRVQALETAPRAGDTSISYGTLVVQDGDTGQTLAALSSADGTDVSGNPLPAGLSAETGDVNGAVLRDGTVGSSKVDFTARDLSGITTTLSPTEPASPIVGDIWIDSGNGNLVKRWDGTTWQGMPIGTGAIQAEAITASLIAANTIGAGQIAAGAITADALAAGAVTAGKVAAGAIDAMEITGATVITDSDTGGVFVYDGSPTLGNLIVSIAAEAGTDAFGNAYPQGVDVSKGTIGGSLITVEPGPNNGIFVYGTAPTVTTFSSGSGTWVAPAGVTSVKVECWGGGGGGEGKDTNFNDAGGGGGGGEYAAETLSVTPGNSYPYSVGAGGAAGAPGSSSTNQGGAGGTTTFNTTSVVAHGGVGGANSGGGLGGSGSTNTTHFGGGRGGSVDFDTGRGAGGGGGSGGTASAGNSGSDGVSATQGGAGAAAVTGGGPGGKGGTSTAAAVAGGSPGGGGGGSGTQGTAGAGAKGRITLTYTSGTPKLLASIAGQAGTDQFGNAYRAGISTGNSGAASTMATCPTSSTVGTFTAFTSGQWPALTVTVPPSETVVVGLRAYGYNSASTSSNLDVSLQVKQGTAVLVGPTQGLGPHLISRVTGSTDLFLGYVEMVIGTDLLAGLAGQTLTITPYWRISSGTIGPTGQTSQSATINSASMHALPSLYPCVTSL
jgi:hypothetical protein